MQVSYIFSESSDVPVYLSVYSTGAARDVQIDKLGVYKITNYTKNGKPTWRNNQTEYSVYYHGKNIIENMRFIKVIHQY